MPEDREAPFASAAQMESRTSGVISKDHPFLEDELQAATGAIRDYCGWHIAPPREVTYRRAGATPDDVYLPAMQIDSIVGVKVDGVDWPAARVAAAEFDPLTGWTNIYARRVEVRYVAGLDDVPAPLVTLTLQVAARGLGAPLGLVRDHAGTVSVTHSQVASGVAGGTVLLAHEQTQLATYRIGSLA